MERNPDDGSNMAVLSDNDRFNAWAKFMSDYSNDSKPISLTKPELRTVVNALDARLGRRSPAYTKAVVVQPEPPLRAMLLRLAQDQNERNAVDAEHPLAPNREIVTLNEVVISQVAARFVAGTGLSVSQEFSQDVCRGLAQRRSELGV